MRLRIFPTQEKARAWGVAKAFHDRFFYLDEVEDITVEQVVQLMSLRSVAKKFVLISTPVSVMGKSEAALYNPPSTQTLWKLPSDKRRKTKRTR